MDPDLRTDDSLTILDRRMDGSIGRLGRKMEYVYRTTRLVPIWEFRALDLIYYTSFYDLVARMETEVLYFHNRYPYG